MVQGYSGKGNRTVVLVCRGIQAAKKQSLEKFSAIRKLQKVLCDQIRALIMKLECQKTAGPHYTEEFEFHPEGNGELLKDISSDMIVFEF